MARQNEELDVDFGMETSPKKLIKFIAFGLGGLMMLGVVGAGAVYMTSPVARHGQESMTAGMPSMLSFLAALGSRGKMGAHDFDKAMSCVNSSMDATFSSMKNFGSDLEHVSPSRRMQMNAEIKEKCGRIGR